MEATFSRPRAEKTVWLWCSVVLPRSRSNWVDRGGGLPHQPGKIGARCQPPTGLRAEGVRDTVSGNGTPHFAVHRLLPPGTTVPVRSWWRLQDAS